MRWHTVDSCLACSGLMKNGICQLFLKFAYWVTAFWIRWPDYHVTGQCGRKLVVTWIHKYKHAGCIFRSKLHIISFRMDNLVDHIPWQRLKIITLVHIIHSKQSLAHWHFKTDFDIAPFFNELIKWKQSYHLNLLNMKFRIKNVAMIPLISSSYSII